MVDLIVVAIIALCFLLGYMRGGLLPLLGLCALVAAYFGSAVAGPPLGEILATHEVPPLPKDVDAGIDKILARADKRSSEEDTRRL